MPGRPKLPVEIKRQRGTLRKYDLVQEETEHTVKKLLPAGKLKLAHEITDPEVKKNYRDHVAMLRALGGVFEQRADSPMLKEAYWSLQEAFKLMSLISELDVLSDDYDRLTNKQLRLFSKYEDIVKDFYITPQARLKLKLDMLTADEKKIDVESKKSAVSNLIAKKQS